MENYPLFSEIKYSKLKPGMIVFLKKDSLAPADILIIEATEKNCIIDQIELGYSQCLTKKCCVITFSMQNRNLITLSLAKPYNEKQQSRIQENNEFKCSL
jgi:magnesium-transporting ATPase (P-type)